MTNQQRTVQFSDLMPNMEYQFNITALTETGPSPPATVLVFTKRSGKVKLKHCDKK